MAELRGRGATALILAFAFGAAAQALAVSPEQSNAEPRAPQQVPIGYRKIIAPFWPSAALATRSETSVMGKILIGTHGFVRDAWLEQMYPSAAPSDLARVALDAVKTWQFRVDPKMAQAQAIVPIAFKIEYDPFPTDAIAAKPAIASAEPEAPWPKFAKIIVLAQPLP